MNLTFKILSYVLAVIGMVLTTSATDLYNQDSIILAQNSAKPPPLKKERIEYTLGGEIKTQTTISVPRNPQAHTKRCEADASIFFTQMDDQVRVKTTIDTKDCDRATGGYSIYMRAENKSGEVVLRQLSERWKSQPGEALESIKFYDMKDAVELKSLDLKRLTCTCDAQAETD